MHATPPAALPTGGVYLLCLLLGQACHLHVGALGPHRFPPGAYLYSGSAKRALPARVLRHMRPHKLLRWHMDALTTAPGAHPLGAFVWGHAHPTDTPTECALNGAVGTLPQAASPVPGFGASDCRAGCPAHLWHIPAAAFHGPEVLARRLPPGSLWLAAP